MNLEVGTQLGDYRILSRIGRGAYGVVYEAEHAITRRIDAVKLMLDAGPSAADEEIRFLREIQVQASLQHPNIATVYGAFRTPWGPALAMELVKGKSLRTLLQGGKLPSAEAVGYIRQVLAGLNYAERLGIVHRDIKPDNILITPSGTVKLTDFGLAQVANASRITTSGENLGTPCYMSPEQVDGSAPADARSDVYSTGVVLYEALTGRPPFTGNNGFAVMLAHQNNPPEPPVELEPSIGRHLNDAILRALEKDPARRFADSERFDQALEQAMALPAALVPAPVAQRAKRGRVLAVAGAVILAACGFGAWAGRFAAAPRAAAHPPVAQPIAPAPQQAAAPLVPDPVPETQPAPPPAAPVRRKAKAVKSARKPPVMAFRPPASAPVSKSGKHPVLPAETSVVAPRPTDHGPAALPESIPAPVSPAVQDPEPPKRRNVFRRALGKIFGRRGRDSAPEVAPSNIKP